MSDDRLFEVDPPPRPWIVAAYAKYQTVSPPAVAAAASLPDSLQGQFLEFHKNNPGVYDALVELALDLRDKGQQVSIGMLFEVIRWQHAMGTFDRASDFKLNNSYRSRYARLIMETVPELAEAFDVRELRAA